MSDFDDREEEHDEDEDDIEYTIKVSFFFGFREISNLRHFCPKSTILCQNFLAKVKIRVIPRIRQKSPQNHHYYEFR